MDVSLRPVTTDNFRAITRMKVREDQAGFVASNEFSLAEAHVFPGRFPLAVYAGEEPVGFCMYVDDREKQEYWIYRLMITAGEQGKGYGRAAMRLLLERMRGQWPDCRQIFISYEPENAAAKGLYASLGFVPTGEMVYGEEVARLDFAD